MSLKRTLRFEGEAIMGTVCGNDSEECPNGFSLLSNSSSSTRSSASSSSSSSSGEVDAGSGVSFGEGSGEDLYNRHRISLSSHHGIPYTLVRRQH